MLNTVIYGMVFLGSALMVYNIYGYIRYARDIQQRKDWGRERSVLYLPILLLVMFLLGYLAVGILGQPTLIVSGILFGGSVYVFLMYHFLRRVTNRIQAKEQIQARLMAAEARDQAKTGFLSSMSHEMRTPMNAIIGLDTIALQDETLTPQTRARLEEIGASARHLLSLINDVLDMSQIESGQMVIRKEPFSLAEVLDLVNLLTQTQCDASGLEYHHEVTGDIGGRFIGDSLRVRQVLLSLLGNAVKYTPAPGTVTFTTAREDGDGGQCAMRFTVRDTGIGMDESFLPKLFSSFSQEDASSTNRFGGSGLGLAITKQLLDQMNSTIAVTSRKGAGSEFVVTIPLAPCDASDPAQGDAGASPHPADLSGRRVLIVEDVDLNAEIVADLLEMEDIESERAENGQAAIDRFSEHPAGYYDAILMDLRMPVMDGLNATRAIRALDRPDARTIPIIALTANALDEDIQNSLDAGMHAHMSKPVDAERLYEILGRLIPKKT